MSSKYPPLPSYEVTWRSIQVEPIPFSGERITVGAIVQGVDQSLLVATLLPTSKIIQFFGEEFGSRIKDSFKICINSAEVFYKSNQILKEWTPPLEGFYSGKPKLTLANSLEEGLFRAAMHCSSYAVANEIEKTNIGERMSSSAPEEWRKNITKEVIKRREGLSKGFEKKIQINGSSGVPIKFGFISSEYAAQFEAVSNTQSLQRALVRAQSKLWQLDRLKDNRDLFQVDFCELLFQIPETDNDQEHSLYIEFSEEIRYEASRREIQLFTASSPIEAAEHLLKNVA